MKGDHPILFGLKYSKTPSAPLTDLTAAEAKDVLERWNKAYANARLTNGALDPGSGHSYTVTGRFKVHGPRFGRLTSDEGKFPVHHKAV
jgi:hypothetical protein